MHQLSISEVTAVFGGDNPGMGPYAPPITQEDIGAFNNSFNSLIALGAVSVGALGTLGPIGLIAGSALAGGGALAAFLSYSYLNSTAAAYNTTNGYNAAGTIYFGSGGGGGGGGGGGSKFLASQ
jgi:hypothetical protein